ncbi:methylmalonyl-CoA mutase family protein [Taibaiella koreensis]|uniref:methylmalonyl-CoA mutase family protein n=1 Tax=Taibaiella koreensis TaxID=1268548 RepID=UPI0013C2F872|nr:methylmalonyl-CoA mutase family protein [Taibaiella koreensis]
METLFKEFHPATAAEWKTRLEKDLKGITFDQLSRTDRNGLTIHPFYTGEDLTSVPQALNTLPGWSICARVMVTDAVTANRQALDELNKGASGICFVLEKNVDAAVLLHEIGLPYIYTCFYLNQESLPFATALQAYLDRQGWTGNTPDCFISFDVLHHYLREGAWYKGREEDMLAFNQLRRTLPYKQTLCVDATLYQNAGANTTYELACALAQVNEYLDRLDAQQDLGNLDRIHIVLATDTAFFEQIAKLRAFRKLLGLLLGQYNVSPQVHLHAETSNIYRSPFDSHSNLLRDSIAGMAAVLGGCNSLYIHSFDETKGSAGTLGLRMSRNQQLIFKEESYLDKVADIAAGSYYLETLTDEIAAQAWEQFKEIEAQGGLIAAFETGSVGTKIAEQCEALIRSYREGTNVLIGVNKFPNPNDMPRPVSPTATGGKGLKPLILSEHIL